MISSIHSDHSQLFWGLVGDRLLSQSVTSSPNCLWLPCASPASGTWGVSCSEGSTKTKLGCSKPSPPQSQPPGITDSLSDSLEIQLGVWKPQLHQASHQALGALHQHCRASPGFLTPQEFILKCHFLACRDSLCHSRPSQKQMRFQ